MQTPLVSLVLAVKNGLPHLKTAMDAVRRQSYRNFEVVVQDGASADGTLEYLSTLTDLPAVRLESAQDTGIGQAYNRGLNRCHGELVCFIASDEQLEDDALERAVGWWSRHSNAVYVSGSVRLIDGNGTVMQLFEPPHFDLLRHLRCETVLAFAGLLNRSRIGADMRYDEALGTCPDYEFWIRLGARFAPSDFVAVPDVFKTATADGTSMTYRPEAYGRFCEDKLFALNRFLDAQTPGPLVQAIRTASSAGISLWAAESVHQLEGATTRFLGFCERAAALDPWSPRLHALAERTAAFTIDPATGRLASAVGGVRGGR